MTGLLTPQDSSESSEKHIPKNRKNIRELASDAVFQKMHEERYDEATLLRQVNSIDPEIILKETRQRMQQKLIETPGEYGDYSESDIRTKLSDKEIISMYQQKLVTLKEQQDRLKKRVISYYEESTFDGKNRTSQWHFDTLEEWAAEQNEHEIIHLLKSRNSLEKSLRFKFWKQVVESFQERDVTLETGEE